MTPRGVGVSIRLKLALSYAGFLIVAGGALVAVGLLVLRFVPQGALFGTDAMIGQHRLLNEVAALVDAGLIRTTLAERFGSINADNLKRAHALIESGKARGKVVLENWG